MLVGFTGKARSGKDTAALFVIETFNLEKYSFAQPIKEACKVMFGWNEEHVNGSLKEAIDDHYGVSPRQAMQTLGTEWGRNTIHNEMWIKRAEMAFKQSSMGIVIPDVRFENEAEFIRDNGGVLIHVTRPNVIQVNAHSSEAGVRVTEDDFVIVNDSTISQLHLQVEQALAQFAQVA